MYKIIEKQNTYGTYFEKQILNNSSKLIDTKIIQIFSFTSNYNDGTPIIMFYDSNMNPIDNAINFVNFGGMINQSQNYILQSISALKFLYSYLSIYNIDLKNMTKVEANNFIDFLKGISREGLLYTTEFSTKRKNETINAYIKSIRRFIDYLGYESHIFLSKKNNYKTIIMPESEGAKTIQTYDISVKVQNKEKYVPSYINFSEYKTILDVTKSTTTPLRDRVICRLLYEHGLRIGEVLGLTLEDIKYKETKDFQIEYYLELRNRVSDTNEQNVKSVMNIISKDSYKDPCYKQKGVGYHVIVLSENLAMELLEYINIAHNIDDEKYLKRYNQFSNADSVPCGNKDILDNYYVFLNTLGKPLSENLWNKNLREIFKKSGLIVDKGVRKNNLNHRLRHGYAMYLTNVLHLSDFDVKTLMRHKNLSTTSIYHNPTPQDIEELQKELIIQWDISLLKECDN